MPEYVISFHRSWIGEHDEEWFASRVEPSTAVVRAMQEAGVLVFAAGLSDDPDHVAGADATSGEVVVSPGPRDAGTSPLGGLTIIDVPDDEAARAWAGRVAEGCGWPQEVRRVLPGSLRGPEA